MDDRNHQSPFKEFKYDGVDGIEKLIKFLFDEVYPHDISGLKQEDTDIKKILTTNEAIEVDDLQVGNYNNNQILFYSTDVIADTKKYLIAFDNNDEITLSEKLEILEKLIKKCSDYVSYFDSMNEIKFASKINFYLSLAGREKSTFPLSKVYLTPIQWQEINRAMSLRKYMFYEVNVELKAAYDFLYKKFYNSSRYQLITPSPHIALMELYIGLVESNSIHFIKGDKETLLKDLMRFFNVPLEKEGYTKDKVIKRENPSKFLSKLGDIVESYSKGLKEYKKKKEIGK